MEKVEYLGFPNCLKLSNGTVEAIVTTDVGPRIIRYGFVGGENILGEFPDEKKPTPWGLWKPYGGHRLWAAPEADPRSYVPDNEPIQAVPLGDRAVRLIGKVEEGTGIQKDMTVELGNGPALTVHHKITNRGLWGIDLAPWALTVMNGIGGGTVILPQEPYISHDDFLLPARPLVMWHYTNLADPRWKIGPKFIRLSVDKNLAEPQKIGIANKQGWAGYHHNDTLFVKYFAFEDEMEYADCGCNCETYTAKSFVEVETLGPIFRLEPDDSADHIEQWFLHRDVKLGSAEDEIESAILPLITRQ